MSLLYAIYKDDTQYIFKTEGEAIRYSIANWQRHPTVHREDFLLGYWTKTIKYEEDIIKTIEKERLTDYNWEEYKSTIKKKLLHERFVKELNDKRAELYSNSSQ